MDDAKPVETDMWSVILIILPGDFLSRLLIIIYVIILHHTFGRFTHFSSTLLMTLSFLV